MESSRRDLFIDMVVDRFIIKNNQITLCALFHLHTQTRCGWAWVWNYLKLKKNVLFIFLLRKPIIEAVLRALMHFIIRI